MNSQEFKAEEAEVESLLDELVQAYEEPEKLKEQIKKMIKK